MCRPKQYRIRQKINKSSKNHKKKRRTGKARRFLLTGKRRTYEERTLGSFWKERADFQAIADRFGIDPVIARLIRNRDVTGEKEIEEISSVIWSSSTIRC